MNAPSLFRRATVFVAGAAHIDRRGRSDDAFRLGASNPGSMRETVGGAAFNAVRALRVLGAAVRFVSCRGGDREGLSVADALAGMNVADLAMTWLDRRTPTYTAILDSNGDLVGGLADMDLYAVMRPRVFERRHIRDAMAGSDAVLLDANLPPEAIERLVERAAGSPVFAIGVSPAKVSRLRAVLPRLAGVFLSRAEAAELTTATRMDDIAERLLAAGCERAVVTDGAAAAVLLENGDVRWQMPPTIASLRDVTGAGDTLAAVAMLAFAGGASFVEAARLGMAAASLHVSAGRRDGDFTAEEIRAVARDLPPAVHDSPELRTDTQ